MYYKLFVLFILCFGLQQVHAQLEPVKEEKHGLRMIARATNGQIKLRWAPTSFFTWQKCNEVGYQLSRFTITRDGQLLPPAERRRGTALTTEPIFPWQTEEEWRPLMERDEFAAIGAQAIFGEDFAVETGTEGEDASLINKASEQTNRYGFGLFAADHSFEAATAMGLAFVDENVKPNETYLYTVYPSNQPTWALDTLQSGNQKIPLDLITRIDTGHYAIGLVDAFALPKILEVNADFQDKKALISWDKELFSQFYVSYMIEKSEDGVNWRSVRDKPFISTDQTKEGARMAFFTDELEQNNKPYFYRIKGYTPFGEYGPPSDPVQGMGIDPLPYYYPTIKSVLDSDQGGLTIAWDFNQSDNDKIRGFKVLRGKKDSGPFETLTGDQLLLPEQRAFIDQEPMSTNYYMVVGVDQYNREMASFAVLAQLDDVTPPAPPVNLRGTILKNGIMVATWDENTEADFLGYRVYVSNHPNAEFTQVTSKVISENHFIDTITLETLTEAFFVKVFAVDVRQNPSAFSEVLTLTRPDTIPPTAPVFRDVKSGTASVYLEWANSSSNDIVRHDLYRSPVGEENWELLTSIDLIDMPIYSNYIDSTAELGKNFQYKVVSVDNGDLETSSKIVQAQIIDDFIRETVRDLSATADRRAKKINLSWQYKPERGEVRQFIIFRAKKDETMRTYSTIKPDESIREEGRGKRKKRKFTFEDETVKMNTTYQYSVKVVYENGAQSKLSIPVQIAY